MQVSRVRFWWCTRCKGVFKKQDLESRIELYAGPGEVIITGTCECNNCHAIYQQRDIYAGKHDLPRQHWAEFQRATGERMEL